MSDHPATAAHRVGRAQRTARTLMDDLRSLPAERALVGGMIAATQDTLDAAPALRGEHFTDPTLGRMWEIARTVAERGGTMDTVTMHDAMVEAGMTRHLATTLPGEVMMEACRSWNARTYARTVMGFWMRRRGVELGAEQIRAGHDVDVDPVAGLLTLAEQATRAAESRLGGGTGKPLSDIARRTLERIDAAIEARKAGRAVGITTGLHVLDRMTGGWQRGDLVILGARPSMGKSLLMLIQASAAVGAGKHVGIFSLEMPDESLVMRVAADQCGIPLTTLRDGTMTPEERERIARWMEEFQERTLSIDDEGDVTVEEICARARAWHRRSPLDILFIDYLQLIAPSQGRKREGTREQEVSHISKKLKALAKQLNITVVALSQLNREVDSRPDKRPINRDLRESGGLEQDADLILFLLRPAYYKEFRDLPFDVGSGKFEEVITDTDNLLVVIVSKQRNGPTGEFAAHIDLALQRVADWNPRVEEAASSRALETNATPRFAAVHPSYAMHPDEEPF